MAAHIWRAVYLVAMHIWGGGPAQLGLQMGAHLGPPPTLHIWLGLSSRGFSASHRIRRIPGRPNSHPGVFGGGLGGTGGDWGGLVGLGGGAPRYSHIPLAFTGTGENKGILILAGSQIFPGGIPPPP